MCIHLDEMKYIIFIVINAFDGFLNFLTLEIGYKRSDWVDFQFVSDPSNNIDVVG